MFEEDFLARNLTIEVQISIRNTEKKQVQLMTK